MWLLPQLRGTIQRVQLDDQMLLAAHPVVLSPAGVGQRDSSTEAGALMMPFDTSPSAAGGQQPLIRCVSYVKLASCHRWSLAAAALHMEPTW